MINKAFAAAEQSFGLGFGEQDAFPPDEYRLLFKLRFSDSYGVHEKERMLRVDQLMPVATVLE